MGGFELSAVVNADNVFLIRHSELEGRWDIDYYRPKINALEKKIRKKTTKKLKDFIVKIASGATPSVQEEAKFYSTKENGIPFLRVQNLNVSGELSLDGVKYINQDTHNNHLRRSQVSEHDLLVKITGVGRMAIASVAPSGFDGNTNQHMVVIKTGSEAQSRYLANYLNLDIIEALATRRSTGATRPALDYPALKSIPIIDGIDFSLLKKAEMQKQLKEQQAQALLDDIDGYLLNALGITLPVQDNRLEKRMFIVPFSELTGGRSDSDFYRKFYLESIKSLGTKFGAKSIKDLSINVFQGVGKDEVEFSEFTLLKVKNIKINNELDFSDTEFIASIPQQKILLENDIVSPFIGEAIKQYKFSNFSQTNGIYTVDNNTGVIRVNQDKCNPRYVCEVLNSAIGKFQIDRQIGGGGVPFLGASGAKKLLIPLPPIEKQNEIAAHISQIRAQAKQLQAEAANLLASAKTDIERMILGEVA